MNDQLNTSNDAKEFDNLESDAAPGELLHQYLSKSLIHLPDGRVNIGFEADCRYWFGKMYALHMCTAYSDRVPFRERKIPKKRRRGDPIFESTDIGNRIWEICTQGLPVIYERFPSCRPKALRLEGAIAPFDNSGSEVVFSPRIWLILRACQRAAPVFNRHGALWPDVSEPTVRDAMTHLVARVRKVWHCKRLRRVEGNRLRNEKERLKSCLHYMATRFAMYSCLLIGRVDLYIRPDHRGWSNSKEAEQHLRLFLRALGASRTIPDVKAWICKRENGPDRGIHYHVLYALDGHKHREGASFSKMLGEAWVKRVGTDRGSYFNCTAREDQYKHNALGLIRVRDEPKLCGLREAIRYMVKGDAYVLTGHQRNLWRGITGKSWNAVKRGAPRNSELNMFLVEAILGNE